MKSASITIGMGGWDLPPFHRTFYPPSRNRHFRKLEYYSRYFDCVEVNATFYSTDLGPTHARRWLQDVSHRSDFLFSVKLFHGFTHTMNATMGQYRAACRLLDELRSAGKLFGLVMQFPYSFTNIPERRSSLKKLSEAFASYRIFLDVRHSSWDTPSMYRFLQDLRIHPMNVDLPSIRKHPPLHDHIIDGISYFRMMGRNTSTWYHPERGDRYLYNYSWNELVELASILSRMRSRSDTIFVIFHNDPEANSLINGFQLRHLLLPSPTLGTAEKPDLRFTHPAAPNLFTPPQVQDTPEHCSLSG